MTWKFLQRTYHVRIKGTELKHAHPGYYGEETDFEINKYNETTDSINAIMDLLKDLPASTMVSSLWMLSIVLTRDNSYIFFTLEVCICMCIQIHCKHRLTQQFPLFFLLLLPLHISVSLDHLQVICSYNENWQFIQWIHCFDSYFVFLLYAVFCSSLHLSCHEVLFNSTLLSIVC
jgi:hypothetical protein